MPALVKNMFDRSAIHSLKERTKYESWLLEAVYSIVEDELFWEYPDAVIYPANGVPPEYIGHGRGNVIIGDWRPGFLTAGAPLIFISTFKLLDMMVEWVLEKNENENENENRSKILPTHKFYKKIKALQGNITFPNFLQTRPWLTERLVGLYAALEPLRGTIIHDKKFKTIDGAVHVSSTKKGATGPEIKIKSEELRILAVTVMSVLRYMGGSWKCDEYRETFLRHDLDKITKLHGHPALRQKKPRHETVRMFLVDRAPTTVNVSEILDDLAKTYPNEDCTFDLRALLLKDGRVVDAFFFPWKVLRKGGGKWGAKLKVNRYRTAIPIDIKPEHCSQ